MLPPNPFTVPASNGIVIPFPSVARRDPRSRLQAAIQWRAILFNLERLLDFVTVFCGAFACLRPRTVFPVQSLSISTVVLIAIYAFVFVVLLDKEGEYRPALSLLAVRETERWLRAAAQCNLLALVAVFLASGNLRSRRVVMAAVVSSLLLIIQKLTLRYMARFVAARGWGMQRTVIVGGGSLGRKVYSLLRRSPKLGLTPVALVDEEAAFRERDIAEFGYRPCEPARILAGPVSPRLLRNLEASVVVIADAELSWVEQQEIAGEAMSAGVRPFVVARDSFEPDLLPQARPMDGLQLTELVGRTRASLDIGKRTLDVLVSALILLAGSPMLLVLSLLVKLTSHGPVFFRQKRIGADGRFFTIYKFRTMEDGAVERAPASKEDEDPRITPMGRFLRKSSLDELPQLFNIIRGDMSLVGPRPETIQRERYYNGVARRRFDLKPGLTGMWQLSAARNEPIFENIEYDLYYAQNRNFFMDVAILMHTAIVFARGR